jgi:hypothetical protein
MSALPPKVDIRQRDCDVRFVPRAEVAVIRSVELIVQPDAEDVVAEMGVREGLSPRKSGPPASKLPSCGHSAHVGRPPLGFQLSDSLWFRRQLKNRSLLTFAQRC